MRCEICHTNYEIEAEIEHHVNCREQCTIKNIILSLFYLIVLSALTCMIKQQYH